MHSAGLEGAVADHVGDLGVGRRRGGGGYRTRRRRAGDPAATAAGSERIAIARTEPCASHPVFIATSAIPKQSFVIARSERRRNSHFAGKALVIVDFYGRDIALEPHPGKRGEGTNPQRAEGGTQAGAEAILNPA